MPDEYSCKHCQLQFSTGWSDYRGSVWGYDSRSRLVCKECGTQHAIEWAATNHGAECFEYFRLIVESVPAGAERPVRRMLRRGSMKLADAVSIVSNPPFVLLEGALTEQAAAVRDSLAVLGVSMRTEFIERCANPAFGPPVRDRLLHGAAPKFARFGDGCRNFDDDNNMGEWLVASEPLTIDRDVIALDAKALGLLACQHCRTAGSLTDDFGNCRRCPACKRRDLMLVKSWLS